MDKICVFCGVKPVKKNKEHVLPQWLLKMTGDPNRKVTFGFNYNSGKQIEFNWQSFTAPSCTDCNERYAKFEGKVKVIVEKLQNREEITGTEALLLLDWLDKVRIGLWINYYYLENNKSQINPRLCIDNRIGKKDRFLQIHFLESKTNSSGLNAFGVETFVFQFNPSCFALRINNVLLFNGSNDFLISKNCGFPYPDKIVSKENGTLELSDWRYDRKKYLEIDNLPLFKGVLTLMQPIQTEMQYESNYYNDSYLVLNCLDRDKRIGNLFRVYNSDIISIDKIEDKLEYESVTGKEITILWQMIAKVYYAQNVFLKRVETNNEIFAKAIKVNEKTIDFYESKNKNFA
ncbi:hypothetical protein [Fulvivirga sediminis]|uniref:Uncharacterized protein n=1 Tax=Fulvivirga sediminis TaxID=2803949 RepID=A0A937FD22_9BACT|nr:hypothetical protein [Fulvivirga sediminis]MBL3658979.1 hypothetical protein [Fulvivirga sediminis]